MISGVQLFEYLDGVMPFDTQEKWDNSGLLVDSGTQPTNRVLVCLDVTKAAVERAVSERCGIILSHHPVIFSPVTQLESDSVLRTIIKNNITVISAHTNFDRYEYGTCYNLMELLGFTGQVEYYGLGLGMMLPDQCTLQDILTKIKQKVDTMVQYTDGNTKIHKIFLVAGSGKGMAKDVMESGADCLITGESGYHDMLDLKEKGISTICLGHDVSENISVEPLAKLIQKHFEDIEVIPLVQKSIAEFC
ncbi:MAG: Nif3-like dinuclear metal center hexameric protein [Oscillospiraceae bacterium]